MHYNEAIKQLKEETGLNIVGWCANNKGNGPTNLHVAVIEPNAERQATFKAQLKTGTVIKAGYTAHWQGNCTRASIRRALQI